MPGYGSDKIIVPRREDFSHAILVSLARWMEYEVVSWADVVVVAA